MKDLIQRLKRTEYDDLDACKAADALELCYEMLDHLCVGAMEWHTEIERLTAELEATKKAVQQNYFRVVEVTAELAETRSTGLHAVGEVARLTAERDALKDHLIFVERWAVHHALKPTITPEEALACIAHYPPIREITKAYTDGVFSNLPNPYAENALLHERHVFSIKILKEQQSALEAARAERDLLLDQMRADRRQYLDMKVERDALASDAALWRAYQSRKQAAINAGMAKNPLREGAGK